MNGEHEMFIKVLLPLPIDGTFTYRVPREMFDEIIPGKRVAVQFGKKKIYAGLIHEITDEIPVKYEAIYIQGILDDHPVVHQRQFDFWEWMASYYICRPGEIMNAALPASLKLKSESFLVLTSADISETEWPIDENELPILEALKEKGELRIDQINTITGVKNVLKYVKSLCDKGLTILKEDLMEGYKPKLEKFLELNDFFYDEVKGKEALDILEKKAPKQADVVLALIASGRIKHQKANLIKKHGLSAAAIKSLADRGWLTETLVAVSRLSIDNNETKDIVLTEPQIQALTEIEDAFATKKVCLLQGVSASGKSFVFIQWVKAMIENGGQALILVPEIAITEQLVVLLKQQFGSGVMVTHSRFNTMEKFEIWNAVMTGEAKVIIGPRSALFLPFKDLKCIVVDEEHENTYKQFDKRPKYHGRDCAIVLAKSFDAPVLLATSTPSVETYFNVQNGKFALVKLDVRYGNSPPPLIVLCDVADEFKKNKIKGPFTTVLLDELKLTMENGQQSILFQNRKGYVPVTECMQCGWTPKCINCDVSLTYYKYSNNLRCHYCGFQQENIKVCHECGSTNLEIKGYGTERLVEQLEIFMPEAKVIRFDQDSTRNKNEFKNLLQSFSNGEADIMVGTQLLAKSLDFENLHLVGVVDADMLMNRPDYKAHERAFQLISQVIGRAGRRQKQGLGLIQSRKPDHFVLQCIVKKDSDSFYEQEIESRKSFNFPPFVRLIRITLQNPISAAVKNAADLLADELKKAPFFELLGPAAPLVPKVNNFYRMQILIKMDKNVNATKKYVADCVHWLKLHPDCRKIQVDIDVDPE